MKISVNNEKFNVEIANTFKKRLLGLMGKKNIKEGLYFPKTNSIHTFFMREPIDVIMINNDNKIVYIKKNLKKNRILIKKKAHHTIELPNNSIKNININDKLTIS